MSLKINWQPGEWDSASTDQRDLAGGEEKRRNYSWHYFLAPAVRVRPAAAACKVVGEHLTLEIYYQHQPSSLPVSISTHSNCGWSQTLSLLDLECLVWCKDHIHRMVIVEGRCTMARSSSFRSKLFIGWHKSIVSSDWSDTMVWFGQILLYFNYCHPIHMILGFNKQFIMKSEE